MHEVVKTTHHMILKCRYEVLVGKYPEAHAGQLLVPYVDFR